MKTPNTKFEWANRIARCAAAIEGEWDLNNGATAPQQPAIEELIREHLQGHVDALEGRLCETLQVLDSARYHLSKWLNGDRTDAYYANIAVSDCIVALDRGAKLLPNLVRQKEAKTSQLKAEQPNPHSA